MTAYAIVVLPEAEAEIRGAFHWYFERSPLAADAFRTEITGAIDRLSTTAHRWAEDEDGVRRYVLERFPYTVHYDFDGQTATVLAVAHQRRRPGYWLER